MMKQKKFKELTSSDRKYLKAIYRLSYESGSHYVRPVDVAEALGVSRPSVTRALKRLQQRRIILRIPQGGILLTERGLQIVKSIQFRCQTIGRFLEIALRVDQKLAEQDAWNLERVVSFSTLCKMCQFNQNKISVSVMH